MAATPETLTHLETVQNALNQYLAQHPDTHVTLQLPGMEAHPLPFGPEEGNITIASFGDINAENPAALQESWDFVLASVRNAEITTLTLKTSKNTPIRVQVVPTNQDS